VRSGEAGAASALRKIRSFPKLEPFEIDLVPRPFGKVDAGEGHAHVFIGRITPPFVPDVLALCRKGKKEGLVVFFG
jgi:hypothetical protein